MGYSYGHGYGYTWRGKKRRVTAAVVGGAGLLVGETAGFATDFMHAVDAERVAVKTAGTVTYSALNTFYQNASTSPKMVYDVAGTLGWSPHNTCVQSQTFDVTSSAWSKTAGIVTANAIAAPDGTMTADAFIPNAGSTSPFTNQIVAAGSGNVVTFSVYAKNGVLTPWFLIQSDTSAWFNLSTGVKGTTTGSPISSNMVDAGNGWYRCDMTFTASAASIQVYLAMATSSGGGASCTTGDGVKVGLYLWGAQMNRGTVPTAYLPTTTAARYGLALDYDPVTHAAKGLLCEPAATNLLLQSTSYASATWLVNGTGATKVGAAPGVPDPFGGTSTYEVNPGTVGGADANAASAVYQGSVSVTVATAYTTSFYLRAKTGTTTVRIGANHVSPASAGYSADLTLTTSWQRFSVTSTAAGTSSSINVSIRSNVAGNTGAIYVSHAQFESGTVATSPIPTLAASVTRAADVVKIATSQINYSATAGSWWAEPSLIRIVAPGTDRLITYTSNYAPIYMGTNTFQVYDGGVLVFNIANNLGTRKVAMAFQSSDRAIVADNLTPVSNATAGLNLGAPGAEILFGTGGPIHGYIRKLRYLPRRPSNAELQTMTEPDYTPITLNAPISLAPAGKMTWNASTGVLSLVGALSAEACTASFGPVATAGRTYRIKFNVDVLAGDSFGFQCGTTSSGQISGTGAKTFIILASGATALINIIEWAGTLTNLTLSNISVEQQY